MKKIFTFFLSTLMGCSLYAQESADRLVIFDKAQNQKSFLVERIDSISFKKIEGVVAADVKVLDITHEKFHFEVLRTPACKAFKLLVVPKVIANRLTNDDAMASYVDENTQQMYWQDFTNGELAAETFEKGSEYVAVTLGFDEIGTPCSVRRAGFTTLTPPLVGDPKVETKVDSIGYLGFRASFVPNKDVKGYAVLAGKKEDIKKQFEQFGPMMGFKNFGDMIKSWGINSESAITVHTWETGYDPNTEYAIFVQSWDKADTYAPCDTIMVTTKKMGGPGKAEVKTSLGKYVKADWNGEQLPSQFIKYEPNDQVSVWRQMVAIDSLYQKDPEGYQNEVRQDPPMPMTNWFLYGGQVFETDYQINPSTKFVVITAAKNSESEWGDVKVDTYETAASVMNEDNQAPKKISSVTIPGSRTSATSMPFFTPGRAPMLNTNKVGAPILKQK